MLLSPPFHLLSIFLCLSLEHLLFQPEVSCPPSYPPYTSAWQTLLILQGHQNYHPLPQGHLVISFSTLLPPLVNALVIPLANTPTVCQAVFLSTLQILTQLIFVTTL